MGSLLGKFKVFVPAKNMKYLFILLTLSFTVSGDPQADKLFEDYFEWKIDTFKQYYYQIGYDKHAGEIDDYSEERFRRIGKDCEDFRERADKLLQLISGQLEVREKRYVKVLKKECEFCVRGMEAE